MQSGNLFLCGNDPATQLRAAQAINVPASLSINLPGSIGAGRTGKSRLRNLNIVSLDNAAWEVWLWGSSDYMAPTIGNGFFLGRWRFDAADGIAITGSAVAATYHYSINGLDVLYMDSDSAAKKEQAGANARLHFSLVPRAGSKTANDAGLVLVQFALEPLYA